jgi:hypothetical protein
MEGRENAADSDRPGGLLTGNLSRLTGDVPVERPPEGLIQQADRIELPV